MDTVEQALAEIAAGRPVVVVDGEDRENEGDLIVAADRIDASTMAFLVRHTSGFVCVALPADECARLELPPLHHAGADRFGTAYRVTVDAASGVSTGISARDRARTAALLASADVRPDDFVRPGHVVPLAARPGGVLERPGHTEAAVDLARMAGVAPAGVLCEIVSVREPGRMARRPELVDFAAEHGLVMVSIDDVAAHRVRTEPIAVRVASTGLPTAVAGFDAYGYRGPGDGEHLALVAGDPSGLDVPVHVHVECLLGDVLGSLRCGCARRLDKAMRDIADVRRGVLLYLRPRSDLRRALLEQGACIGRLEAPCAELDPALAASILTDLGVGSVRHLHNPAAVRSALDAFVPSAGVDASSDEVA